MNKIAAKAIASAGASVRALNPQLFGQLPPKANPQVECAKPKGKTLCEGFAAEGKRIRQDAKPLMNKLETEFLAELQHFHPGAVIWKQALRWKLGNGIWYKPDFAFMTLGFMDGYPTQSPPVRITRLMCCEVKGPHAFRGGFENLKVAASLYPEVRWVLAWKEHGEWKHQDVMP